MIDYNWLCNALSQAYPTMNFEAYQDPLSYSIIFFVEERRISVPMHFSMSQAIDTILNQIHRKSKIKWTRLESK